MTKRGLAAVVALALNAGCSPTNPPPPDERSPASEPATAVSAAQSAPDRSLFNLITLGAELELPRCHGISPSSPCLAASGASGEVSILLPELDDSLAFSGLLRAQYVEGAIERVTLYSRKDVYESDALMLEALVQKYGEPTSASGPDYDWVAWDFEDLHVFWLSSSTSVPYAVATVETPTGKDFDRAQQAERDAAIPRL